MVEFLISGPIAIGTVLSPVPISGSIVTAPPGYIGTIGTILTPVVVATVLSPIAISGSVITTPPGYIGTVAWIGTIGTILNAPLVTVQGVVTVALDKYVGTVAQMGTLGTVLSPLAIGTILSQVGAAIQQQFAGTQLLTNSTLLTSGMVQVVMGSLQDLRVDYVFGTAVSGSVLAYLADVEEQTGFVTGTIVAASWWGATVQDGHALVAVGPHGYLVGAGWSLAAGGTYGVATVTQVYITARLSEGP